LRHARHETEKKKKQARLVNPRAWPDFGEKWAQSNQKAKKYVRRCLIDTEVMIGQKLTIII